MATSRIVEHVGRVLSDRYRLTRPLGTGASAHVYVAEDVTLRRRVAVKLLHPGLADDDAFLRRFQAEARVVAALRHPNIVRVYDWGEDHGTPFLVMELLEGGSLRSLLDRGQLLSPAQAARIGADAARALDYAHRRSLVHRDIKPANLLFDEDGQVSVADFGLARALAEATWTEPVGAMVGTARYAAPEQIGGGALDGKADVYALAVVLVEAVTGRVPFAADTTLGALMGRVDHDLPVTDELGPLRSAIAAAGTSDPGARSDAGALAAALAAAAHQLPSPAALTLAGDTDRAEIEDDPDLTEFPGRAKLFDAERVDRHDGADRQSGGGRGPVVGRAPGEVQEWTDSDHQVDAPPGRGSRRHRGNRSGAVDERSATALHAAPRPLPTAGLVPPPGRLSPGRRHKNKSRSRRKWLIPLLVVLLAAGSGAGYVAWSRLATPSHPVPSVVHDTPAAARQALAGLHLHLRVSGQAYNDQVAEGLIVSQVQPVNSRLREGSSVSVVESLGPPPVTVPDLTGLSLNDATNRLIGAQFKVGVVTRRYDNTPKDTVLSWSGQGQQLPKGSNVDLVVSNGPPVVTVPSITGGTFGSAQSELAALNLSAVETDVFSNSVAKGQVISSSPAGGTSVQIGTSVKVTVSKGPDLVTVPDVHGQTVDAASQALQAAGFSVVGVTGNPTRNVTHTSPAGNAQVLRGSSVTLFTT